MEEEVQQGRWHHTYRMASNGVSSGYSSRKTTTMSWQMRKSDALNSYLREARSW